MFRKFLTLAVMVGTFAPIAAKANLALAQKNACMACHAVDKNLVDPSYKDVANKYKGQNDAGAALAASIKKGGAGKWGPMAMPPQTALSDSDAKTLANWILSIAK